MVYKARLASKISEEWKEIIACAIRFVTKIRMASLLVSGHLEPNYSGILVAALLIPTAYRA